MEEHPGADRPRLRSIPVELEVLYHVNQEQAHERVTAQDVDDFDSLLRRKGRASLLLSWTFADMLSIYRLSLARREKARCELRSAQWRLRHCQMTDRLSP